MNQTAAAASTSRNSICTRRKEGSTSHKEEHRGEQNRLGYMFSHKEMTEIPSTKAKENRKERSRATKNGFFFGLPVAHGIPRARERTAANGCAGEEEEEHGGLAMGLKLFGLWRKPGDCRGEAPGVDVGQVRIQPREAHVRGDPPSPTLGSPGYHSQGFFSSFECFSSLLAPLLFFSICAPPSESQSESQSMCHHLIQVLLRNSLFVCVHTQGTDSEREFQIVVCVSVFTQLLDFQWNSSCASFQRLRVGGVAAMAANATLGNAHGNKRRIYATIMHEERGRRKGRSKTGVGLRDL